MGHGEGRAGGRNPNPASAAKKPVSERLRDLWPDIWELVRPRRGLLFLGFILICIGNACGFVLPVSSKYLFDLVIKQRQIGLLLPLTLAVLGATAINGVTSFTLTQLLS